MIENKGIANGAQKVAFWTAKGHVLEDKRIGFGG